MPKLESQISKPFSPYDINKYVNERYLHVFWKTYCLQSICLRYFNLFGPLQEPITAYAAVIPKWIASMIKGESVYINADGENSRDFRYIANVVHSNLLATTTQKKGAVNQLHNITVGQRTTHNELYVKLKQNLNSTYPHLKDTQPVYREFRTVDVIHSLASIDKSIVRWRYEPTQNMGQGLGSAMPWYKIRLC